MIGNNRCDKHISDLGADFVVGIFEPKGASGKRLACAGARLIPVFLTFGNEHSERVVSGKSEVNASGRCKETAQERGGASEGGPV